MAVKNLKINIGDMNNNNTAHLKVTSEPPGAEIYVDGIGYNETPKILNITLGNHKIEFIKEWYEKATSDTSITKLWDELPTVKLNRSLCNLTLHVIPDNAVVHIERELLIGRTKSIERGIPHKIQVDAEGYYSNTTTIAPDSPDKELAIELKKVQQNPWEPIIGILLLLVIAIILIIINRYRKIPWEQIMGIFTILLFIIGILTLYLMYKGK